MVEVEGSAGPCLMWGQQEAQPQHLCLGLHRGSLLPQQASLLHLQASAQRLQASQVGQLWHSLRSHPLSLTSKPGC
jgi:hypothetical protein